MRRTLAMMDRNDDGCRLGESLGNIGIHAHLSRTSIEVIDLLELAVADRDNRRECC